MDGTVGFDKFREKDRSDLVLNGIFTVWESSLIISFFISDDEFLSTRGHIYTAVNYN